MCQGLNSHYFHIIGDGHQPNSRGLYTHCNCLLQLQLCQLVATFHGSVFQWGFATGPAHTTDQYSGCHLDILGWCTSWPANHGLLFISKSFSKGVPISKPCGLNVCLRKSNFCKIPSEKQIVTCLVLRFAEICTMEVVWYLPQGFVSFLHNGADSKEYFCWCCNDKKLRTASYTGAVGWKYYPPLVSTCQWLRLAAYSCDWDFKPPSSHKYEMNYDACMIIYDLCI